MGNKGLNCNASKTCEVNIMIWQMFDTSDNIIFRHNFNIQIVFFTQEC